MDFLIEWLGGHTKRDFNAAKAATMQKILEATTEAGKLRDIDFSRRMASKDTEVSRRLVRVFSELGILNSGHKPMKDHIQSLINAETSKLLDAEGAKKHAVACRAYESRLGAVSHSLPPHLKTALGVGNTKSQCSV